MEKKIAFAFLYILLFPALILLLSGDFTWINGWIFIIWFLLLCYSTIYYLYRKDPALLAERYIQPGAADHETLGHLGCLRNHDRIHRLDNHHATRCKTVRIVPGISPLADYYRGCPAGRIVLFVLPFLY